MVTKLTIFEPRFDGARFGPTGFGQAEPEEEAHPEPAVSTEETSTRSRGRRLLRWGFFMGLLAVGIYAVQRSRRSGVDEYAIEEHRTEGITAE